MVDDKDERMSELTESLSHLIDTWHGEEPSEDWWKWQHDVAAALVVLEAQEARIDELKKALTTFVDEYTEMVESGDCGFWDPEKEDKVIAARKALAP